MIADNDSLDTRCIQGCHIRIFVGLDALEDDREIRVLCRPW